MLNKLQNRRGGFTLVEIMIVVAIIALLAAIAIPSAIRARKRAQATSSLNTLRVLDSAMDQAATENGLSPTTTVAATMLMGYVKSGSKIYTDLSGTGTVLDAIGGQVTGPYTVDKIPQLNATTFGALSDVAPASFWGAYYTAGS